MDLFKEEANNGNAVTAIVYFQFARYFTNFI